MRDTTQSRIKNVDAFAYICEGFASDAAFLWLLRSIAVNQPNYNYKELNALDKRIEAQLDGLISYPEDSWEVCSEAMEIQQCGEVFTASVVAFRSLEVQKIQQVVEVGVASEQGMRGLAGALAWLPDRLCHSWIKKFFTSKDLNHKYLAVTACSLRREDPREYLTTILQREDCTAHDKLYERSLRLIGELKRRDLRGALTIAIQSDKAPIQFWATWSALLFGDKSVAQTLLPFVLKKGPYQSKAIAIAFRNLSIEESRTWIGMLAKDPANIRSVIHATAVLGDPHAVNWLIAQMRVPALTRMAGEAFSTITGIDLEEHKLALDELPDLNQQLPNDDPNDSNVDMDEDERLPFPEVDKVAAVWEKYQQRFVPAQRYFMGQMINAEHLMRIYTNGNQRQRRAAALELALLKPDQFLLNHAAKGFGEG